MSQPLPFAPNRPLLGVARSALGRPWRARLDPAGQAQALAMMQHHGLADLLARVLAGRGIAVDEAVAYLDPTLRQLLPDPSSLADMDAAAARLAAAIEAGETIAIFGDYDVDGAASAALLDDFLTATGTPHLIHIPDRIFEGYGPNVQAIAALAEAGATLLVCVDCGTTSHAPLAEARRLGLDVIVLDHHQAPEQLPDALVVNPNRQDDLSGLGQLCAAGVVFLTLIAVNRVLRQANFWSAARPAPDLLTGLDLVALATVADVAPLTGLNRAFVTKGLALMRARERPGLAALFDVAGAGGPPSAHHLGFLIGPRINAGGRIGDAALGAKLLASRDSIAARDIAETAEPSEPRAADGGSGDAGDRDRRGARGRRTHRGERGDPRGGRWLASGRGRSRRVAAQGTLPPAGLRHRLRGRHGHRLRPLDPRRRYRQNRPRRR